VTTGELGLVLLADAAVVLAATVAARVAHGIGLPGLPLSLGLGLALGEAGVGVRFDDAGLAEALGLSALVLILATAGVVVSVLVVAMATRWLLGLGWRKALLLGAALAPTDAATVFPSNQTATAAAREGEPGDVGLHGGTGGRRHRRTGTPSTWVSPGGHTDTKCSPCWSTSVSCGGWGPALGYLGPRVPHNGRAGYVAGQDAWGRCRFGRAGSPAGRSGWLAQVPRAVSKAVMKRW
jgi:hypothetical protein